MENILIFFFRFSTGIQWSVAQKPEPVDVENNEIPIEVATAHDNSQTYRNPHLIVYEFNLFSGTNYWLPLLNFNSYLLRLFL